MDDFRMKWWDNTHSLEGNEPAYGNAEWFKRTVGEALSCTFTFEYGTVLDIACGTAPFVDELAKIGLNSYTGIEMTSTRIGIARERYKDNSEVKLIQKKVGDLTLEDFLGSEAFVIIIINSFYTFTPVERKHILMLLYQYANETSNPKVLVLTDNVGAYKDVGKEVNSWEEQPPCGMYSHGFLIRQKGIHPMSPYPKIIPAGYDKAKRQFSKGEIMLGVYEVRNDS